LVEKYVASIPPEQYEDRLRIHVRDDLFAQRAKKHAGLLKRVHEETEKENQAAEQARTAARAAYEKEHERFFREIALYEINAFIGHTTGKKPVPVPEPRKGGGYTAQKRAEIVKALTDQKAKGAAILEAIRSFILHELFKDPGADILAAMNKEPAPAEPKTYPPPGGFARAIIRDADLRRLVRFMGEKIGKDMTLSVLLKYAKAMPRVFNDWTAETAKVRKITQAEARRFLAERVTFIAECGTEGYPIERVTQEPDVMDCDDLENFARAGGRVGRREPPRPSGKELQMESQLAVMPRARKVQRLAKRESCWEICGFTEYEWKKAIDAGLIVPIPSPTGGKAKYDIDAIMEKYPPQKSADDIAAILRGEHRRRKKRE
jgi:hypothetical protein